MAWVVTATVGAIGATGAAVVGAAAIGAVASNRASKRAAKGQREALAATSAAATQARDDIRRLFGEATAARRKGFGEAIETIAGSPAKIIEPFQKGNVLAQEQVIRGLPQIQNAILGLPTDLSGFKPRTVGTPESFNFDLTGIRPPPVTPDPANVTTGGNFLAGDDSLGRRLGRRRIERFLR